MNLHREWVRYGDNEPYIGYSASLANVTEPLPAVIVLQEIWGVDEHIRSVADRFALAGYAAFAPDLFAENGVHPEELTEERIKAAKTFLNTLPPAAWRSHEQRQEELAKLPEDEGRLINETLGKILNMSSSIPAFVANILSASAFLRDSFGPAKGQPVVSVGFCMGGALSAALAAQDPKLSGAVIFYGNPPSPEAIGTIRCPLLGFYGELDQALTDKIPDFAAAMREAGKPFEYHVYPGAKHAFFNDTRPTYHPASARDAYARTLHFLQQVTG